MMGEGNILKIAGEGAGFVLWSSGVTAPYEDITEMLCKRKQEDEFPFFAVSSTLTTPSPHG